MSSRGNKRRSDRWREGKRTRINIVPLIDVMFLLLCFFILVTLSMVFQHGIFVDLATAESGQSVKKIKEPVVVSVKSDGSLHLDKEKVTVDQLSRRLKDLSKKRDRLQVFLNADEKAEHADVVKALDVIRRKNVEDVIFTVKSEQQ